MVCDRIEKNSEVFERDVFRDFCLVSQTLGWQCRRFAEEGAVSFSIIQTLVGEPLNKGQLWRLKDLAHHVFQSPPARAHAAPLLDWTLGYIFHESLKLMEDAHQRQYYAPRMSCGDGGNSLLSQIRAELTVIQEQTQQSIQREVARLEKLLSLSRKLFCLYFEGCANHKPLARYLCDNEELVSLAFGEDYQSLLQSVYGGRLEVMYVQAARSLLESGRFDAACKALETALQRNSSVEEAHSLMDELNRLQRCFASDAV